MRGDLDWSIKRFHSQYGEVVRFSPEELSFTNERAWKDIYGHKTVPLVKDPMLYNSVKLGSDGATSIFNASPETHSIIRKQLGPKPGLRILGKENTSYELFNQMIQVGFARKVSTSSYLQIYLVPWTFRPRYEPLLRHYPLLSSVSLPLSPACHFCRIHLTGLSWHQPNFSEGSAD